MLVLSTELIVRKGQKEQLIQMYVERNIKCRTAINQGAQSWQGGREPYHATVSRWRRGGAPFAHSRQGHFCSGSSNMETWSSISSTSPWSCPIPIMASNLGASEGQGSSSVACPLFRLTRRCMGEARWSIMLVLGSIMISRWQGEGVSVVVRLWFVAQ